MMMMTMMNGKGGGAGGGGAALPGMEAKEEKELSLAILLAERVSKAAAEAESFRAECGEVGRQAELLLPLLRSAVRRAASSPYPRPARRVLADSARSLERALALLRRCRRSAPLLRRVLALTTTSPADFRRARAGLDASLADLRWLLAIYEDSSSFSGPVIGLPPIASTDPILSWVWSYLATTAARPAAAPADCAEAALALANLARDNDRNKAIILEEGGAPPLLALLRDGPSVEAQVAAAAALHSLANSPDRVAHLLAELAVPAVVHVLADAPMELQARTAELVSQMAAHLPLAQEEFARENAVRPLVSLLAFELPLDDARPAHKKPPSIHSLVQGLSSASNGSGRGRASLISSSSSARDYYHSQPHRKERENESPEVKLKLKTAAAEALWMLAKGCLSNARKIAETKGLLCLARIVEREKGELQRYCLMTIVEIAAAAEADTDLRRSAFKTNSPAAKAAVDQLLRVAQVGSSPGLQIAAMKAIGSLARTFPARETRVLSPLVLQLGHWNPDVAAEAARALGKFASPENFNCVEHSKAMIEFAAVPPLMRLLRTGDKAQLPGVTLLCYLALHVAKSEALERAKALGALDSIGRTPLAQDPSLRDLLPKAIYQLEVYKGGDHTHKQQYCEGLHRCRVNLLASPSNLLALAEN